MSKTIESLVQELYAFADRPDALILREFIAQHRLTEMGFAQLAEKNPELEEAYHYARLKVGINREIKALEGEINTSIYRDTQPLYDDQLKAWEIEKKKGIMTFDEGLKKLDIIYAKASKATSALEKTPEE